MINVYDNAEYGELILLSDEPEIVDNDLKVTYRLLRPTTVSEIGTFLDEELENANNGMSGIGGELAKIIYNRNLMEAVALEIFHKI